MTPRVKLLLVFIAGYFLTLAGVTAEDFAHGVIPISALRDIHHHVLPIIVGCFSTTLVWLIAGKEEALLEVKEQFNLVTEQSPSVYELYDIDGLQIEVNKAYEDLWQFPEGRETTVGKFNILESKEVENTGLMTYVKKAYAGETVAVPPYRYDPTGETEAKGIGRVRWLSTRIYPIIKQDKVANIVIRHEDISDKMFADDLRTALLDNIPGCSAMILKKYTREIVASNSFAQQIGAIPGSTCFETCASRDDECPFCLAPELWETNQSQKIEVEYSGKWYEGIWAPLSDELYVHYVFDIDERKLTEKKLLSNQYYLKKAQEIGSIGTWEIDILNNTLVWTDENYRIFGVPLESIVNYKLFIEKVHPGDREYVDQEWQAAMKGKLYDIEHRLVIDGKTKWVREKADMTFDGDGNAISAIGFTQDITELKLSQEKSIRAAQMASVGELSASIAHEVNNPLSGVIGYAQILLNKADDNSSDKPLLELIIKEGERIANTVKGLLNYAYDSGGKKELQELNQITRDAIMLMSIQIKNKGIRLEVDLPDGLPVVKCNAQQIEQVILNIMRNAYQALLEGVLEGSVEKVIKLKSKLIKLDNQDFTQLTIANNGPNIPQEIMAKVNEPFFTTKPVGTGTGLGLSISNDIMENHGGTFDIKSEPNEYTEMILSFPVTENYQQSSLYQ